MIADYSTHGRMASDRNRNVIDWHLLKEIFRANAKLSRSTFYRGRSYPDAFIHAQIFIAFDAPFCNVTLTIK